MTIEAAKVFIDKYFEVRKPVRAYIDRTLQQALANGYVETMFGCPRDDWVGIEGMLHVDDRARILEAIDRHCATGAPLREEYRMVNAHGYLLWVLEGLREGEVRNPVRVPEPTASEARTALDRMLAIR